MPIKIYFNFFRSFLKVLELFECRQGELYTTANRNFRSLLSLVIRFQTFSGFIPVNTRREINEKLLFKLVYFSLKWYSFGSCPLFPNLINLSVRVRIRA